VSGLTFDRLGRRGGKEGTMIVVRSRENGGSDTVLHDERGVSNNKSQPRETANKDPVRLRDEILEAAGAKCFH